jgi:hypothetical protein
MASAPSMTTITVFASMPPGMWAVWAISLAVKAGEWVMVTYLIFLASRNSLSDFASMAEPSLSVGRLPFGAPAVDFIRGRTGEAGKDRTRRSLFDRVTRTPVEGSGQTGPGVHGKMPATANREGIGKKRAGRFPKSSLVLSRLRDFLPTWLVRL